MNRGDDFYRAIVPEGGHLASWGGLDDAFLGSVLDDSNQIMGQAKFVKVDRPEVELPELPFEGLPAGQAAFLSVSQRQ